MWHLILIAFLVGIVNAFDVPIRQAFLVQMVGKEDLPNAIALNSSMFNSARVVGPPIAGFVIAYVHEGWCFFLNGVSFLAVIVALLAMRIPKFEPKERSGFAVAESSAGISVCDERFADPLGAAAAERAELVWTAVLRVSADFCARRFASRGGGILVADEFRGRWCGAGCAAFCGADELQGLARWIATTAMICVGLLDYFFAVAGVLVVDGGLVCGGICGDFDDGGDEYDRAESRAG